MSVTTAPLIPLSATKPKEKAMTRFLMTALILATLAGCQRYESPNSRPEAIDMQKEIDKANKEAARFDSATSGQVWILTNFTIRDDKSITVTVKNEVRDPYLIVIARTHPFYESWMLLKAEEGKAVTLRHVGNSLPGKTPRLGDFLAPDGVQYKKYMREGGGY